MSGFPFREEKLGLEGGEDGYIVDGGRSVRSENECTTGRQLGRHGVNERASFIATANDIFFFA